MEFPINDINPSSTDNLAEQKKPKWKRLLLIFFCIIAPFACMWGYTLFGPDVPIRVSKETTRITEPLGPDGLVDYFAALRNEYKEGVTPENNAAVLLWQAWGPGNEMEPKLAVEFFKELGIPIPPIDGKYLIAPFDDKEIEIGEEWFKSINTTKEETLQEPMIEDGFAGLNVMTDKELYFDLVDQAMGRPWTSKEIPPLADWLRRNKEPINLIFQATHRPRMYDPIVGSSEDQMLIESHMPMISIVRNTARVLKLRGMNHLGEGRVEEAIEDAIACHRLARLVGQGSTLTGQLVAIAIDGIAFNMDIVILNSHPTRKQLEHMKIVHAGFGNTTDIIGVIDKSERYQYLEFVQLVSKNMEQFLQYQLDGTPKISSGLGIRRSLDFNIAMEMGNEWLDKFMQSAKAKLPTDEDLLRFDALDDFWDYHQSNKHWKIQLKSYFSRRIRSEQLGGDLMTIFLTSYQALNSEFRSRAYQGLARVGIELEIYRTDHGEYPKSLEDLDLKVLKTLPKDIYTEKPFRYERRSKGYLLYSLGPNHNDNGGSSQNESVMNGEHVDPEAEPKEGEVPIEFDYDEHDDYLIRLPLPALKLPITQK